VSREKEVTRPAAEKVTPSQHGRFLGALEKKEKKDVEKKASTAPEEEAEGAEDIEEPVEGGSVFHLAKAKSVKQEDSFTETSTGEEGEAETGEGKSSLSGKKTFSEVAPDLAQQQAVAAQAQMQAPKPIEGKGEPEMTASSGSIRKAGAVPQQNIGAVPEQKMGAVPQPTTAPEEGVAPTQRQAAGFRKALGEEKSKEQEAPEVPVEGAVVQKPLLSPTLIAQAAQTTEPKATPRAALLEVIRQAADAIATFVTKHETRTVITIKQPPIFEGATLTVTEYSSAPRQFNITFTNLSPDAQRLVESMANQQQLKQTLIEKGYTVQNVFIEATPRSISPSPIGETRQEGQPQKEFTEGEGGAGEGAEGGDAPTR
jgi:hypothetical protein